MNNIDQLFVRACKAGNPDKRLQSVYRRFYLSSTKEDSIPHIVVILGNIIDKYLPPIRLVNLLQSLDTEFDIPKRPYRELCLQVLTSKIRYCKATDIQGIITPIRFR